MAALEEMEATSTSTSSTSTTATNKSKKSPLRRLLEEAGWDGSSFSSAVPHFDARALLSRLKTLHFDDLEEVGKGSYAVVYKVCFFIFIAERKTRSQDELAKLNLRRN